MDCMIIQSLVTISNHEITAFLDKILKREQEQQGSLFQADLTFGADSQLTIFPPIHLFQQVLTAALLSVGDSALQVFDSCNSPASKDSLTACFQDLSPRTGLASSEDRGKALRIADIFSSIREPCLPSTTNLVLSKRTSLRVQGQRVRGQYYPLSRKQLEWHLRLHVRTQEIEEEQERITQEAHQEIEQLCEQHSWLVDTHLFTTRWSTASLESMRGWPAIKYKEHIQKVHFWRDGVFTMPLVFTTSNKLLTVTCSHIQEKLVPLLTTIEEDSLKLMSDELQLHSANLTSELKKVVERLRREPTDLSDFANYAAMVKRYNEMSADMQQQLDNLRSLQKIIEMNCRNMTPGESACMEQTHQLWKQFIPLLKQATHTVNQQLPSMTNTLDCTVSTVTKELEDLVCSATTGPYLDPNQSTVHMISELRIISRQFNVIAAQLNELSRNSLILRGHLLDLTFVTTAKQNIEARKELWELKGVLTAQIQEWRLLLFSKFVVSRAQEKVSEWLQETVSIAKFIPPHDAVLQETLCNFDRFNQHLSILAKLSSPTLTYKHWRNIFKGMGLPYDPEQNLTVADLMSRELLEHQNKIIKICREAKCSADMEHVFRRLQQSWEGTEFRLAKFIVTVWQTTQSAPQQQSRDSGTFTIMGEKVQLSQEDLKIIAESTTLSDATPSTLAQCGLVYVSGKDLWKSVWKAEMDALYRDCALDKSTLTMWSCLAEDLFSRTLIFLKHNALATVMSSDGIEDSKSGPGVTDGLQEVTSFIKILHAFLGESGCGLKTASKQTEKRDTSPKPFSTELQARNLFAVAYIWGFGGQLHPRYWPHFDILAREALFESRYQIEVPAEDTVFEHFFSLRDGMLEDTTNAISLTRKKRSQHFHTSVPQYEKHAYLLDLMLEAQQPALLVGEAGSGKTTLCKSLLSQERPHMHLPASPLLHSTYLRNILESMGSYKTVRQHPGLLLFVDDLHEVPFDDNNGKTSMLLENLRQCISRDGVPTSDGCHFKLFCSGAINYLADKTLVASIAQAMPGIHQSAIKYASTFLNIQPFSPHTYFELMTYFSHLSVYLCEQVRGPANRVATVLARVKNMTDTAQEYNQELFRLQAKVDETKKWLNQLQIAVDTERTHCEQARQHCLLEEGQLSHLEEQLELADQQAQDALNEVSPFYQVALKALQSLNQSDLDEVRHYRHPPDGVVMLINAICMLFNRPCNWESGKQLLEQPNFLQELEFFDRSNLNDELFQKLGQVVKAPNFQPHLVRDVSRACESLSCWLQAVYQYACVQQHMAPWEAQKKNLLKSMAESRARLRVARLQEEAAQGKLEDMEKQQQLVRNDLEDLAAQLQKVEAQEKEAAAAIKQLSNHTEKWISVEKELKMNSHTISGDALILASAIVYLGPFGPDIRLDMLEKWNKMCLTGRIDISPEDPQSGPQSTYFQDSLFVPIPVAMELHRAVARAVGVDDHLIQAVPPHLLLKLLLWGHRVPWAHKWALLADTQQHVLTDQFLGDYGRSHKDEEYELVVSADDPEFLDKLRQGAEKGLRVLITHVEHAVASEDFLKILVRPGGSHCVDVFHSVDALHCEFRLFISTALPVRVLFDEIHPLILEKVKVINLSLSTSEVQDIVLNNILQSECSEVWIQHCQAKRDKQVLKDKLHLEEASLMDFMLQSFTPLLQDPEFLPRVSVCQKISLKLHTEIEQLSSKMDYHKPLLNECHRIAVLATDLYKALQEVGRLSPFYSFPLHNFLLTLREALALKDPPGVACSREVVSGVAMSEISHRIVSHILAQYRPCLLQSHAEVLRMLVSVAFFKHNEGCSEAEHVTFLKGISHMESTECAPLSEQSAIELPSWIPLYIQADIRLLEKIPPFHGLVSTLRSSSRQWQEYLRYPSSTVVGPVPCQSHSHLTTLQRAILWKTFFPQWLAAVADDLTACQQGQSLSSGVASGPHTGSPEALSHCLSRYLGPVIVTLPSQSQDDSGSIHPVYWIKQVAQYQADKKGVKVTVISFGSECQRDVLLSALDTAVQAGHWLVLNNCHLLDHWDVEVVSQVKQLMSCTTKGQLAGLETVKGLPLVGRCAENHVHPNFRLWFITKSNAPLSVPAVVRTGALHLVCGSHWDLKDELCSSLRQVISTTLPATSSRYTIHLVEPLIRCAILHSVLLQRQKLKHLGQGNLYNWTQEDLLALVDAQVHIAQHCRDPTGALEYIAAYLTYGGHVSDSADFEVVEAVCRVCLRPAPLMLGSGPHTLSEMIMTGYFDEKDLLKGLEQRVQTTLSSNDSGALGFSKFMTNEMVKVRSHRLSILLLQSQGSFSAVRGAAVLNHIPKFPDYKKTQKTLRALHDKMSYGEESKGICEATVTLSPLRTFLQTEWEHLTEVVSSFLDVFQPSSVPSAPSYVTSSTISKLETRSHLLRTYQSQESNGLCHVYCLSAFANPRGFLAALIRETVHIRQRDISHFSLHFQVLDAASPASMPSSGICLSGLELHGALWDTRLGVLQDTLSSKPCPLPYLWVRAQERDKKSPDSCSMPLYNCPLYLDNEDEDWSLSEVNIVTHVPLMTRLDPALCTLRRVRLVSTLQDNSFKY
ncbi:hypothetical protein AOLI_G00291400 [Acnodon oligacanthus]